MNIKEHSGKRSCKKNKMNKNLFFFYSCCFFKGLPPFPQLGLWTFEPAFSPRFLPTLSLRSFFPTGQRFLPTLSLRSIFSNWSAVFTHLEPTILFSHWSAVSPFKSRDFRLPMSPRSFLSNGPRFPTPEML